MRRAWRGSRREWVEDRVEIWGVLSFSTVAYAEYCIYADQRLQDGCCRKLPPETSRVTKIRR
jgi:hypothetical protein